jgi:hypothetical protein
VGKTGKDSGALAWDSTFISADYDTALQIAREVPRWFSNKTYHLDGNKKRRVRDWRLFR